MTAEELNEATDPEALWDAAVRATPWRGPRQILAAVGLVRLVAHLFVDARTGRAVDAVESFAGRRRVTAAAWAKAARLAEQAVEFTSYARNASSAQHSAATTAYRLTDWEVPSVFDLVANALAAAADPKYGREYSAARRAALRTQLAVLRCAFGGVGRAAAGPDPAWLTSPVLALVRRMYESRDFALMPILADALEDAGCEDGDILAHCRGPGPHVRGCWVVDLVLGKT